MPAASARRRLRFGFAALIAVAISPAALGGCGGGRTGDGVVARVGSVPISRAELSTRMSALAPEHAVPDAPRFAACIRHEQAQAVLPAATSVLRGECEQRYQALQRQALGSLIVSRWLVGEAVERGLLASGAARSDAVAEGKLRAIVHASEPPIGRADALRYYRANSRRFERQELRYVDLAEDYASAAAAAAAKRRIEAAGDAAARLPLHEVVERFDTTGRAHTTEAGKDAIFSARPGEIGGPVELTRDNYTIFEVVRIVPSVRRPFADVERSIVRQLERAQSRRSLTKFIATWRAKWLARTTCTPRYVVPRCRNYGGARESEDALAFA